MLKRPPGSLTRREFWPLAAGMFSLAVGCSRRRASLASSPKTVSTAETHTITHALGTAQVPKTPQRIVALTGISELEALLVLGVKPLAAAGDDRHFGRTAWHSHLKDQMQGVEMLPSRRNINLEKISTLRPDLLIGTAVPIEAAYSQLSQIAPTVALDWRQPWQGNFRLIAEIVGQSEQAETWLADFEQRVMTLAAAYQEALAGTTYTTTFYNSRQRGFHMIAGHGIDQVFQQIGLTRPPEQTQINSVAEDGLIRAEISLERLDLIDTDVLFFYHYDYPTIQKASERPELNRFLEREPLLRRLRAVEADRVFVVPAQYWFLGRAMGIPMALDDLETAVLPLITQ